MAVCSLKQMLGEVKLGTSPLEALGQDALGGFNSASKFATLSSPFMPHSTFSPSGDPLHADLLADLPAWELIFYEVIRQVQYMACVDVPVLILFQVFVSCEERGVLLERIRARYSVLHHHAVALQQLAVETRDQKGKNVI